MKKYFLPITIGISVVLIASYFLYINVQKSGVLGETELHFYTAAFPNSNWKLGYTAQNGAQSIFEYVPITETVEYWSQLVTEQSLPLGEDKLDEYISVTEESFREKCTDFQWEVLSESKNSAVYTWSHNGCDGYPPTFEITKVVIFNEVLYRLAYDKYTSNTGKTTYIQNRGST